MTNAFLMRLSAIAAVSLVAATTAAGAGALPRPLGSRHRLDRTVHSIRFVRPGAHNGLWIAYSTAPAGNPRRASYGASGSDIFMIRPGGRPRLVAGRDGGKIWNICPAFSPDGRMLAFGRKAPAGPRIVVVRVASDGTLGTARVVLRIPGDRARCPSWSSDGSRLAYLDANGKVVVLGLDGSTRRRADGDPTIHDFDRSKATVLSPTGTLVASLSDSTVVVSRPDGAARRVIEDAPPSYAIAGWSPDGRRLLLMRDVGGGFRMRAVSVAPPFRSQTVVADVRVNNERSWPGYGDVSWQPVP